MYNVHYNIDCIKHEIRNTGWQAIFLQLTGAACRSLFSSFSSVHLEDFFERNLAIACNLRSAAPGVTLQLWEVV